MTEGGYREGVRGWGEGGNISTGKAIKIKKKGMCPIIIVY